MSTSIYDNWKLGTLYSLLRQHRWEEALWRCELYPREAMHVVSGLGWTPLHFLCSVGSSPVKLFVAVAEAYPQAVSHPDKRSGDTPLHLLCRNSQGSVNKLMVLFPHCRAADFAMKNKLGHTPLHTACCSNAILPVLKRLVEANPSVLRSLDDDLATPLSALWASVAESIPLNISIAGLLKGSSSVADEGGLVRRFWEKVLFLALADYEQDHKAVSPPFQGLLIHALIEVSAPLKLVQATLSRNPSLIHVKDMDGNTPLHALFCRREGTPRAPPYDDMIELLLPQDRGAASHRNKQGRTPLVLAIEKQISWDCGLGNVALAAPSMIGNLDPKTGLSPFLLAARRNGINTTFELLSAKPDILKGCFSC